jgi:GT2 family glycosyltransferase
MTVSGAVNTGGGSVLNEAELCLHHQSSLTKYKLEMDVDLSIIIVNWKSKDYVRQCIKSIYATVVDISYEIIVVDGASYDGCGEMIKSEFPYVSFVQSEMNGGFSRANNLGYCYSRGGIILFVNPDTLLLDKAINILYSHVYKLEKVGVIGARLLNTDGSIQTTCIQSFPTIVNQLLDLEILRRMLPHLRMWGIWQLYLPAHGPLEVQAISGACMMIQRKAFEQVGRFSEEYFMYSEDVDLCYKCCKGGLKNYLITYSQIIHHGGCSSAQSSASKLSIVMLRESRRLYFRKHKGELYSLCYRGSVSFAAVVRLGILCLLSASSLIVGNKCVYKSQMRKWLYVLKWSFGLESWVDKPCEVV